MQVRCGHLTVVPNATTASLDDLIKQMDHGVVVRQSPYLATDQQLTSASIPSSGGIVLAVEHGRVVGRVTDTQLYWNTKPFLKGLVAIGDRTTVEEYVGESAKGQPWHIWPYHTTAPAALLKEVDVTNIGKAV